MGQELFLPLILFKIIETKYMKKIVICLFWSIFVFAQDKKEIIEKSALEKKKVLLSQSDFDSGTYRITAGGYYQLREDIIFNPKEEAEKIRTDKPFSGWFASITVETDEATVIDLNQHLLASSATFDEEHLFNVFAQIELDNCPFSGTLYGFPNPHQAFVNFKGDLQFVSASNVVIKNGILGRSGHWGIHGNNNNNIYIENLIIKDWEVRGIELNGLVGASLREIEISGLEHIIKTSVPLVGALQVKKVLQQLAAQGYKDAQIRLQKLEKFLEINLGVLNPPQSLPIGTIGGIVIAGGGVSNVDFPVTSSLCAHAIKMTGGRICSDILIEDITIHDLAVNSVQYAAIGSNQNGSQGNSIGIENLGLLPGGSLLWKDAYDCNGNFNPSEPLQATVFAASAFVAHHPNVKKLLPKNFDKIVKSILEKNETLFLENSLPIYTYPSHKIKGLFGIRIEGAEQVALINCNVWNLSNVGSNVTEILVGAVTSRTSAGTSENRENYISDYRGNDIWGYELATCKNCIMKNCKADTIISNNGNPFGFELIADNESVIIDNCYASNIVAYGDTMDSSINLPSESYGFRVQNTKNANHFISCSASYILAPIRSFGFAAEHCEGTIFDRCEARNIISCTRKHSTEPEKQQVAFGFNAEGTRATQFRNCNVKCVHALGAIYFANPIIAAGFAFTENDLNSAVFNCDASQITAPNNNGNSYFFDDTSSIKF
jgi:hypothetical protein